MPERTSGLRAVVGSARTNGALRRVSLAYGCFIGAEWGVWIALLVFAYEHGGTAASSLMALVQVVPSALAGPVLGGLADRRRPGRVLLLGAAVQVASMAGAALSVACGAPPAVVFVLAPITCVGVSMTRPAQAALLPSVVRTPEELTASTVLTAWVEQAGKLVSPVVTGVLLATSGPAVALAAAAGLGAGAGLLVWGVPGAESEPQPLALGAGARDNLAVAWRDPATRLLLGVDLFYQSFAGMLDLIAVVLAVSVLGLGHGGPGYLTATVAAGGLVAGAATAQLVGRTRLAGVLVLGIAAATLALALVAVVPTTAAAVALLAVVGMGSSVFEVAGLTLLQRAAPSDALAGIFSLRESLMDVGLAVGVVVVQVAVVVGGYRAALVVPAAMALVLLALAWHPLQRAEAGARVPQVEIRLLRSIPIFRSLPGPALEGVARRLVPVRVPSGTVVVREGEEGDRYYAVADGTLSVHRQGRRVATLGRGHGFGEIALVHGIPRVATVVADTDAVLYGLDKDPFVLVLTGHPAAARSARQVADDRLPPAGPAPEAAPAPAAGPDPVRSGPRPGRRPPGAR